MLFSDVSTEMSILFCQYDLGFDPFLVGDGFHYYFCFILLTLFVICELYIMRIFIEFYNPRINKVIIIVIIIIIIKLGLTIQSLTTLQIGQLLLLVNPSNFSDLKIWRVTANGQPSKS